MGLKECKHGADTDSLHTFKLIPGVLTAETKDYPAVWICKRGCGYWLNFDPLEYEKDGGGGIAYLELPDPNRDWKDGPKMSPEFICTTA